MTRGASFMIGFLLIIAATAELDCQSTDCLKETRQSLSKVLLQTQRVNGRSQTFKDAANSNEPEWVKPLAIRFVQSADGDSPHSLPVINQGDLEQSQNPENMRAPEMKAAYVLLFPMGLSLLSMVFSYIWFTALSLQKIDESSHGGHSQPLAHETSPLPVTAFKKLAKDSRLLQPEKSQDPAPSAQQVLGHQKPQESDEPGGSHDSEKLSLTVAEAAAAAPQLKLQPGNIHSGGEIVVEALRLSGVERLFGIPGVQNLALYNAICRPQGKPQAGDVAMHLIGNEEAAAYMAWGVWHKEKRLGCACLIGGPGVTHSLAGVACAFRDGTPMLVLTAGVRAGNERFQLHDVDNLAVLKPVCKALFRPASVEEICAAIAQACKCSLQGRPGPVGVEIACDLYNKHGSFEWDSTIGQGYPYTPIQQPKLPTRPASAALAAHASDPLVSFIKNLTLQARGEHLKCTLVAEPGYCAEIAAIAWESSDKSWQLLCPGCGSRPSSFAAENPGVAVPSAIGVARGEAKDAQEASSRGVVIAFSEARALLPQGLELSHAQGLPLLLVVLNDQTMDAFLMAKSMGIATYTASGSDLAHFAACDALSAHPSTETNGAPLPALQHAASAQTSLLTVQKLPARVESDAMLPQSLSGASKSLVDALTAADVELLFSACTNPGHKRLLRALEEAAQETCVNVVACTDAQSVGFMADGAARCFIGMNSTIGACLLDSVDAFSLPVLSGVGEAWQDGVPLLLLVLSPGLEEGAESGSIGPLAEFSKQVFVGDKNLAEKVRAASQLAASPPCAPVTVLLPRSDFLTSSRGTRADCPRGPSLVECHGPALAFQPTVPKSLKAPRLPLKDPALPPEGAKRAVELLLSAHRPWIHVGMGCANRTADGLVQRLAESLEAPVSTTFSGKGVIREDHPLWLWPIAGPAMPNQLREVADTCDTILILGAQMGEIASCRRQWPARRNTVIHVDADPCVLGANFLPDLPVLGDAAEVLGLMLEELARKGVEPNQRPNSAHGRVHDQTLRADLKAAHESLLAQMRAEAVELPLAGQCSPFGLYAALQKAVVPGKAVFVSDSGNGTVLAAEFLRLAGPRRFLAPTDFSSMGYCVPAALGAALAGRSRGEEVVCVATVGDGAFLMTGLEMATAASMKLPVICVILRDGELGMISGLQRAQQNEVYCTHVPERMDMVLLGKSFGIPSRRLTSDGEADEVAEWAYKHCSSGKGPVLIEAMVCYGAPSFYARGATGQMPTAQVNPLPTEPLPLVQLPVPSPKDAASAFTKKALEHHGRSNSWDIAECLRMALASHNNDKPNAIQDGELSWSYAQMAARVFLLREALKGCGIQAGERVGIILPNSSAHLVSHYAVTAPGLRAVALNLSPRLQPPELLRLLDDAKPSALISHVDSASLVSNTLALCEQRLSSMPIFWSGGLPDGSEGPQNVVLEDVMECAAAPAAPAPPANGLWPLEESSVADLPCEMYFTSGTSGRSKGVLLSHAIVHTHALHCISEHRFSSEDVWLHVAPMFHLVDAFAMFSITAVGGKHVLLQGNFDPEGTLETMRSKEITATNMATSMVNLLLASPSSRSLDGRFPSLRLVSCGGAPLSKASVLRAQRLFGCEFFQSYGMTECCGKISMSMLSPEQRLLPLGQQMEMLCSSGKPFEGIEVRVADVETAMPVPQDGKTVGEVQLRGPTVFKGYLKPESGVSTADPDSFLPGGWFRTGDLAYITPSGFLHVIDRLKDMILVGSENVYCIEVENALFAHPAVSLCSVYGVPGPEMIGELVKAVVMVKDGVAVPSTADLQKFCGNLLADFKIPRLVEVVQSMPLNSSGKVIKSELKKRDSSIAQAELEDQDGSQDLKYIREHCYELAWCSSSFVPCTGSFGQWLVLSAGSDSAPVSSDLLHAVSARFAALNAGGAIGECSIGDVPTISNFAGMDAPAGVCLLLPAGNMVDMGPDGDARVRMAVQRGLCMMLAIVRTAEALKIGSILVATQHPTDQAAEGQVLPKDPAIAACWAFARAAAAESDIAWRLVELCGHASPSDAGSAIVSEAQAAHLCDPQARSEEVAWAGGRRFVPRLKRLQMPETDEATMQLAGMSGKPGFIGPEGNGSSCIVVGGNGSLGRLLVSTLQKCGQLSDIVVAGRSKGGPGKSTLGTDASQDSVSGPGCHVHYFRADAADLKSCETLMEYVSKNSKTCSHILNLAGFLPESGMVPAAKDLRWADCAEVLRPKVDGTLNLASTSNSVFGSLGEDKNACTLVCFSSIFGVLSYPRLAPYGAANGFQDGFTALRSANGQGAQAVAWGAWAETGMAHRAGAGFHAFWASEGMGFVPPEAGMELLCHLLACKSSLPRQVCVFPANQSNPSNLWPAALFRHVLARDLTEPHQEVESPSQEVSNDTTAETLETDIRAVVVDTLRSLLGCEPDEVPMEEPFATAGITSMMAVDLTSRVSKALSITLPATLAFEVVSGEQLCSSLVARLKPKVRKGPEEVGAIQAQRAVQVQVVGGACTLPGGELGTSTDLRQMWSRLVGAVDCVRLPPLGRPVAAPRDTSSAYETLGYSEAGYLDAESVTCFDPPAFGMGQSEAEILDPQQRLCVKNSLEAMEDAGVSKAKCAPIGVYVGVTTVDFTDIVIKKAGPPSAYTGPALTTAICSNRVSYIFDLQGPSASVDTACSSSLVCCNMAMAALRNSACTGALVLGVNVQFNPYWTEAFAEAGMLSPTGRCRFGDNRADGYVRGEGCSCIMLAEAETYSRGPQKAAPYAALKGSFSNQDGRSNGLTAPNPMSQAALLTSAWMDAGISPADATYAEAHGTGTSLGDPIEIVAMGRALRGRGAQNDPQLANLPALRTASFKSNIGHLECGAGAASLTKLVLVLHQSLIPPSLHLKVLNEHIDWEDVHVKVVTECQPLNDTGSAQAGCVSGFGFGGSNANAVLCSSETGKSNARSSRAVMIPLVSRDWELGMKAIKAWVTETSEHGYPGQLESIARAAALKAVRPSFIQSQPLQRQAVVASSIPEFVGKICTPQASSKERKRRLALVLNGVGDSAFATLRLLQAMAPKGNSEPLPWHGMRQKMEELSTIGHGGSAEAASFTALHCAAAAFIEDLGVVPSLICGQGIAGEVASFTTAGVLRPFDGIKLASERCDVVNSFWPPTVPVASAQHGLLSERPSDQYFQNSLAQCKQFDGLTSAVKSLQCDVVMEICLGSPAVASFFSGCMEVAPQVFTVCLGSPADGRVVSSDLAERAILEAAAGLFSCGIGLTFAGSLGEGPVARLPPTSLAPKVCWPCDPAESQWQRQDLYSDAYEARWLATDESQSESVQNFLVSGGDSALQMASSLSQRGCTAKVGDPSALPPEMELGSTVFVFIAEPSQPRQLQETLADTRAKPHALLQWLRALPKGPCKAAILSVGAHGSEIDLRGMPAAAMWGAARSARQELRSDISLRCIDLDSASSQHFESVQIFNSFADELTLHAKEVQDVLLVPPVRKLRTLQSLQLPLKKCDSELSLPETFGITGGTGALGLMTAEWLTGHGVKLLVLASRAGKVPEENSKLWQALSQTQAKVQLCKCDVGQDPNPMAQILRSADAFGLAHLAGVLHDGRFTHQNFSTLDMTMKPKVDGAAMLLDILRSASTEHAAQRLKHLWLFSSVTSCLGNMGQTAYGAANSALDAMSRAFWPGDVVGPVAGATLSLQWGPWADFGMASALPEGSTSIFRPWKGDQAFLALEATLGAGCPVACLTQFDWNKVRQDFGESPYHRGFMREVWGEKQKKVAETVALSSHQGQSFADVKSALVQTLQKFLPNGLDGLTDDAELDELGLDSLSGVEASRALAAALAPFGVKSVKPTFLFEANCLNAILSKLEVPTILPEAAVLPTVAPQAAALKKVPQASSADIKEAVIDSLSRFLPNGREGLTDTAEFDELGLDSLSGVEASRALAAALNPLGITGIKPTFLFEANSLQSLLAKLRNHQSPQPSGDAVVTVQAAKDLEPDKAPIVPVNIHSIGEASPLVRQLFGIVSAGLASVLQVLSYGPFFLLMVVCFPPIENASAYSSFSHLAAVFLICFLVVASMAQLFTCFFLMWMAKNLFLGTVKDGIWPIWGWKMACLKGIRLFEEFVFVLPVMRALERSEMRNFAWRLMGSQVGRGAFIAQGDDLPLIAWDLLSIGENTILDGINLGGSNRTFHFHRPLSIGSNCVICQNATLKPGAVVGDGAIVLPHCTVTGEVGAQKVHDGSAGTSTALSAVDIDSDRLLSFPRRTPMSLGASFIVMPFLLWLKVLSLWPFLIDLSYIFMKLIPLLVGGRQPTLSSDLGLVVVVLPAILVLSTLLYDMFVVLAAIGAKWVLLGRFQEGSYSVSHLYLFFFEVSLLLTTAAAGVMKDCSQTIANTFLMKAMGGDVAWSWMPSPLNPVAYFCADLISIESDVFTSSRVTFNCITLEPSPRPEKASTAWQARWKMTCRRIHMKERSFAGPWTLLTGGSSLGQGAATMDQTYVPAGMAIPAWRTMMGTSFDGRFVVKRKQQARLPHGIFPYASALLINAFAGRFLRIWTMALPFTAILVMCQSWGAPLAPTLGRLWRNQAIAAPEVGIDLVRLLLFFGQSCTLSTLLEMVSHAGLFLLSKHCLLGRVTDSSGGQLRGWDNLKWASACVNTPHNVGALKPYSLTPLLSWLAKAGGAQVGKDVQIHWKGFLGCPELDMITLGDDVYLGGAFYSHKFAAASLAYSAVKVGRGAHTGGRSMLSPGCHLPPSTVAFDGALVIPGSANMKSDAKQYLSGNPAISNGTPPAGLFEINGKHL